MYHGWCGSVRAGGRLPSELITRARSAEVWDGGHRHARIIIHRRHAAALWEACSHETVWALWYHTQSLLMLLTRWVSPRRYTHTNYNHKNHNHCTEAACEISAPTQIRVMSGVYEKMFILKLLKWEKTRRSSCLQSQEGKKQRVQHFGGNNTSKISFGLAKIEEIMLRLMSCRYIGTRVRTHLWPESKELRI